MGMCAVTKAGDIQYTTLVAKAANYIVLEGFDPHYGFTWSEVNDIVAVLKLMQLHQSVRPDWKPVLEDTSIDDGTRGWYFRKLQAIGTTIDKLEAWLLLNEELLSFG